MSQAARLPVAEWFREHAGDFSGALLFEEPLARHTYYRIGGPAAIMAAPRSVADLHWLAEGLARTAAPFFVLGAGSNVLASDAGFAGVVIRTARLNLEVEPKASSGILRVRTGGSVPISTLLRRAVQEGWGGIEFLTGIPGTVGGAVFMNAGTHLGEACERVRRVEAFSLRQPAELLTFESSSLQFEYRRNRFLPPEAVVYAAEWEVRQEEPARVKSLIDETLARRKATQPIDLPSCGSVFRNPRSAAGVATSAWQVVDQLGLRGHRIGNARFSEKHSNFIVNLGGARAEDVRALIELAKTRASAELALRLEEEVVYLGF
ncbi:MAG: UDP-N-acetylmuramate dehydrogenase [Oligoflexia bacterium]|nr:UDP-N-acetylmuramate dehydrogenase [Oligoflexia bacterium]